MEPRPAAFGRKLPGTEVMICSSSKSCAADEFLSDEAVNLDWGARSGCLHRIKMSDCAAEFVTPWPRMQIVRELTARKEPGSREEMKLLSPSGGETQD